MTDVAFETIVDAASAESRGCATQQQAALLETDLDAWSAALRQLAADVDDQIERRRLHLERLEAEGNPRLAGARAQAADWQIRATKFQAGVKARRREIDLRRAGLAHQQLRREIAGIVAAGQLPEAETAILADYLAALDVADPLPALATG